MLYHAQEDLMEQHAPHVHADDVAVVNDDVLESLDQGSPDLCLAIPRDGLHPLE